MIVSYKYRLNLTKQQQQRIDSWMGACRLIYNMALELKIDAFKKGIPLSFFDLQKQLPDLKSIDWIQDVPASSLVASIQTLERAYKSFFNGAGFPRFRSKKHHNTILFKQNSGAIRQISQTQFRLPKIGVLRVFKDRLTSGPIKTVVIKKEAGHYYLTVAFEKEPVDIGPNDNQVGIDVGVANFAALSNGTLIKHPRLTFKYESRLRKEQRKLSRCKAGSNNRQKQALVVRKLYQKICRSRQDFLHKVSIKIIRDNQVIVFEKLNIKGMVRTNLAKHISDSGWHLFKGMLEYKSELYGRTTIGVPPHFSSQECHNCGHIEAENRQSQSIFVCVKCGHEDHADLNASKNLLRRGQRLLAQSTDNSLRLAKEPIPS